MPDTDQGETWATMASRNTPKRYIQPTRRRLEKTNDIPLLPTVLFEENDLEGQILADKAMDIIQQSLSSGSVLFSFQNHCLVIALMHIDSFKNKSHLMWNSDLSVEMAHKAMEEGVQVKGVQYKAVSAHRESSYKELKHVHFTLFRMVDEENFLLHNLPDKAFFEGKMSMMIDTSAGYTTMDDEWHESKPLGRMLYLSAFDCFVPAVYKGAPTICHFCRQSGHIRSACPELAKRRCFGCNQQGHMLRFCPDAKRSDCNEMAPI
ncbi:hypothetical protein [Parasitella parasitica]|uniref:CCHC-type domain-containing protein n=1 Tax=Parasitella parasitica TaxID=35722 RepID=A0A0B7N1A5_9FUNG|nr:hypothetical protein [Parasitella parasitica]